LSWEGETSLTALVDNLNEEFAKVGVFSAGMTVDNMVQVLKHHSQGYGSLPGHAAELLEWKRRMAYSGGHIEMFRRGEFEKVWNGGPNFVLSLRRHAVTRVRTPQSFEPLTTHRTRLGKLRARHYRSEVEG